MPAPKIRTSSGKGKQFANIRLRGRRIQAMAVPRGSDVSRAAHSLVRGRLPDGSLLSSIVNTLVRPGIPRSARPVGPVAQANKFAASLISGSDVTRTITKANRPPLRRMVGPVRKPGLFRPNVRLNPSMVSDRRMNTPVETRAAWDGRFRVGKLPNLIPVPPLRRVNPTSVPRVTMSASARATTTRNRTGQSRSRLMLR